RRGSPASGSSGWPWDGRSSTPTDCSSSAPACSAFLRSFSASCSRVPPVNPKTFAGALLCSAIVWSAAVAANAATLFDPALRFRVLSTGHFFIYFHQGEQPLAARLAAIAEETRRSLERPLGPALPLRTHVVLANQTELANGYATPLPRDTI